MQSLKSTIYIINNLFSPLTCHKNDKEMNRNTHSSSKSYDRRCIWRATLGVYKVENVGCECVNYG